MQIRTNNRSALPTKLHQDRPHREAGMTGLDIFTEWKTVYIDYSGALQRAQIDTN